jgi:hypothetical protein
MTGPREDPRVTAERDRQLRVRQLQELDRRAGMPNPRVRALTAGPLVARRGPDEQETRTVQVWHRMPSLDASHTMTAGCWCMPKRSREADGTVWLTHNVTGSWEEPNDSSIAETAAMINGRER